VDRAVVPSYPIHPRRGGRYAGEVVGLTRELLSRHSPGPAHRRATPKRLYVSRGDARKRHVANESEVEEAMRSMGFTCLTLTGMPVAEQLHLFSHAQTIVAQHGAGLTNILVAGKGTKVIELYPRGFGAPSPFWTLASLAELDYEMLVCDVVGSTVPRGGDVKDADIEVDVNALRSVVPRGPR
jgi:capsular polysaccharide biosynthesis protein